jgi:carboxyl-terminal processing protease
VADAFLDQGEIVSTRGRRAQSVQRFNARPGDIIDGTPMVVLINGGSASASEIVAGALQDHRRGIVMGTASFGKGSVQTIMPISGQGAIRLTTARYYTPAGTSIQAKGITPDIEVHQANVELVDDTNGRREADLRGRLDAEGGDSATTAETSDSLDTTDYQLARAIDLLRGIALYEGRATTRG